MILYSFGHLMAFKCQDQELKLKILPAECAEKNKKLCDSSFYVTGFTRLFLSSIRYHLETIVVWVLASLNRVTALQPICHVILEKSFI